MLAVPVSLIGTFIVFPLLGFSVNTLSLFGLVLAIGLVVDDAIVVVEAVEHHIENGMSPKDATVRAMVKCRTVSSASRWCSPRSSFRRPDERHPGPAEPAVRDHDRRVGRHLRVQRARCPPALASLLLRPRVRRLRLAPAVSSIGSTRGSSAPRRLREHQSRHHSQAAHRPGDAAAVRRVKRRSARACREAFCRRKTTATS